MIKDCCGCMYELYLDTEFPCDTCSNYNINDIWEPKSTDSVDLLNFGDGEQPVVDNVNSPAHYNHLQTEAIDVIKACLTEEQYKGYLLGNILKYRLRAGWKHNRDEDLKKSNWYQDRLEEIE